MAANNNPDFALPGSSTYQGFGSNHFLRKAGTGKENLPTGDAHANELQTIQALQKRLQNNLISQPFTGRPVPVEAKTRGENLLLRREHSLTRVPGS